jgi:uncharacterized protein with gpF-like domain
MDKKRYIDNYLEFTRKQEDVLSKQVKRAINQFIFAYAKVYSTSSIIHTEDLLLAKHKRDIADILSKRYAFVISNSSKAVWSGLKRDVKQNILINMTSEIIRAYVIAEAAKRALNIGTTSITIIKKAIDIGIAEGLSITEIAGRIRGATKLSTQRAETIARTEVHGASSYGSIETVRRVEQEFNTKMMKEWVATNDARTRDSHAELNGVKVKVNEKFDVNGSLADRPLDPSLPVGEIVNCRCALIYEEETIDIE